MINEKPPLKLLVEPDQYLCTWLIPDRDGVERGYPGALDLQADRHPTGSVYGDIPIQWTNAGENTASAAFPQKVELPHLRARLANGHNVDLVDVSISYWHNDQGYIGAGSATVGATWNLQEEDDSTIQFAVPAYPRVSAQVGALDAIAGALPFLSYKYPEGSERRHLEGEWSISGNPESSQEWTDDDVTVRLEYDASVAIGNSYAFRFVVSPVVRIESREALTIREWADRWILPLQNIVSIATGDAQPLTYLSVSPDRVGEQGSQMHRPRQVYGTGITQKPYQSNETSVRKTSTAVQISIDGLSLLDMIKCWQKLEDDHHPLIETYGAMLSATDEHPRSRFLLLLQALEGLHGYETAAAYEGRQGRHTETRAALIKAIEGADTLNSEQMRFLKKNLVKRPQRGLGEALSDLLKELPVDLTPRLSGCDLLAGYLLEADGSEVQRVASALSRVRNDLAHGNKGFDAAHLHQAVRVLERIVRANALRLLECPESVLEKVCDLNR